MNKLNIFKRIKRKIHGISSKELLTELRNGGAEIGEKVIVFDLMRTIIDPTRPYLLKIGSYTKITGGCVILTHDYSLSVLRRVYGDWIGEGAVTEIGDNCFIGMNSIILMGSRIGNNVIVGAGSVVHGEIPDNVVVAGNPAKVICTLDEHYRKRKEKTIEECKSCAKRFYEINGEMPNPRDLSAFKFLFTPREQKIVEEYGHVFTCNGDEPAEVEKAFYNSVPYLENFENLIEDIKK